MFKCKKKNLLKTSVCCPITFSFTGEVLRPKSESGSRSRRRISRSRAKLRRRLHGTCWFRAGTGCRLLRSRVPQILRVKAVPHTGNILVLVDRLERIGRQLAKQRCRATPRCTQHRAYQSSIISLLSSLSISIIFRAASDPATGSITSPSSLNFFGISSGSRSPTWNRTLAWSQ